MPTAASAGVGHVLYIFDEVPGSPSGITINANGSDKLVGSQGSNAGVSSSSFSGLVVVVGVSDGVSRWYGVNY
jgi:hypothetical protein